MPRRHRRLGRTAPDRCCGLRAIMRKCSARSCSTSLRRRGGPRHRTKAAVMENAAPRSFRANSGPQRSRPDHLPTDLRWHCRRHHRFCDIVRPGCWRSRRSATPARPSSDLALCIVAGIMCIVLSPGCASDLVRVSPVQPPARGGTANGGISFNPAVGAFLVCAVLIVLCGLIPALTLDQPHPEGWPVMLAGIRSHLPGADSNAVELPYGIPIVLTWLVLFRWLGGGACSDGRRDWHRGLRRHRLDQRCEHRPHLEIRVAPPTVQITSIGPLFIVTMAGRMCLASWSCPRSVMRSCRWPPS